MYLEHTGSDHEAIGFTANWRSPGTPNRSVQPLFNYKKADWDQFKEKLRDLSQPIQDQLQSTQQPSIQQLDTAASELM